MSASKQSSALNTMAGYPSFRWHDGDSLPHWKRPGADKGHAAAEFTVFTNREGIPTSLSIDTQEFGASSSKRTMVTLSPGHALKLAQFLVEHFAPDVAAVLDLTTATVELNTGNGARSQPNWPRDTNGNIDHDMVAKLGRAALALAKGAA